MDNINAAYQLAKEKYAAIGVDTDKIIEEIGNTSISLHCWQGDDVGGFETPDAELSGGGIQTTGNYPGKATTIEELQSDLEKAYSLLPGKHRLNLHAIYGDFNGKTVDRDEISINQFQSWIDWAKNLGVHLDFNATCFSHPKAADGFTLSNKNKEIRDFWISHVNRCRGIAEYMGKEQGTPCVHNLWIPDGAKDTTIDKLGHRALLKDSLDKIFAVSYDKKYLKDAVESKLFGIGSESFVVGSHDFYLGYALLNKLMICLDIGHFHPTESCADKVSAILQYSDEILLHVTRGIRWDSDHVVTFNDEVKALMEEVVRANALSNVNIALDFFDASINRIGAWVVGSRATLKALLSAMLEPTALLKKYEDEGKYFERLAILEECKTMPFSAIWDYYCQKWNVPTAQDYIADIQQYEAGLKRC